MNRLVLFERYDLQMSLIVARREIRDSFRDWRIVVPIILLTIGFPALMTFTAERMLGFAGEYGGNVVAERLIPLLLMVVGFFPTSFCLIIALETFVGEKERKSLEPLLATPLSNAQLYIGKMMAAVVPPVLASYLGILVYVISLIVGVRWEVPASLLLQVVLLTTVQAVIMVAAAVIVSSQTTSVRAANLLASFIIVPMTLLIQAEAAALFWGNLAGLWWLILALTVTAAVLVRMGIQVFNREELLGRDIDHIRLGWAWRQFWGRFSGRGADGRYPRPLHWYRQTWALLPKLRLPGSVLLVALLGGLVLGAWLAHTYQMPPAFHEAMTGPDRDENLARMQQAASELPLTIFVHNVRAVVIIAVLGAFTFGVLGIVSFILPWALVSFIATQFAQTGEHPLTFFLTTVAPHGLVELPALLVAAAAALRWHTVVIAPRLSGTVSEDWLAAAADFARLLIALVVPLLLVASFVEAYVTPLVVIRVYGA